MARDRILATALLLIALVALAASKAFPFLRDMPDGAQVAVVIAGVVCGLAGVWLWLRKGADQT